MGDALMTTKAPDQTPTPVIVGEDKDGDGFHSRYKPVSGLNLMFGRLRSKANGWVSDIPVPKVIRPAAFSAAGYVIGMKLEEASRPLDEYSSFSDLFSRRLKPCLRTPASLDENALLSPVDGTLINYFKVGEDLKNARVAQVKGASYHVPTFLGEELPKPKLGCEYFATVIYLSPADYHHFHSPADVKFTHRKHFHGEMYPVAPVVAKNLKNLFSLNERVCLSGTWTHGIMHYAAVAAYNVGDIRIAFDPSLRTNTHHRASRLLPAGSSDGTTTQRNPMQEYFRKNCFDSIVSEKYYYEFSREQVVGLCEDGQLDGVIIKEGSDEDTPRTPEEMPRAPLEDYVPAPVVFDSGIVSVPSLARIGEFKLGSTIVMIFEAPQDFTFVQPFNTPLKIGQLMGYAGKTLPSDVIDPYDVRASPRKSPQPPLVTRSFGLDELNEMAQELAGSQEAARRESVLGSDAGFGYRPVSTHRSSETASTSMSHRTPAGGVAEAPLIPHVGNGEKLLSDEEEEAIISKEEAVRVTSKDSAEALGAASDRESADRASQPVDKTDII